MPDPGENIQSWSTTAATNSAADSSINWAEGQARASVNNSARSMMAAIAKHRNLTNGSITTTGTANAQAFLSGLSYTTVPTGMRVVLKIGAALTNTGAVTLNMDSIGAVTVSTQFSQPLSAGMLQADAYAEFIYQGSVWILLGPPGVQTIPGVRDGSNAASGYAGEYYELISSSGLVLTANTYTTIHTVTLNPGEWEVRGKARLTGTAAAAVHLGLSVVSNGNPGTVDAVNTNFFTALGDTFFMVGPTRFALTANDNIYLVCFPVNIACASASMIIQARRIR